MINATVKPWGRVLSVPLADAVDRLWDIAWNQLEGESTWLRCGENSYEWFPDWYCFDKQFRIFSAMGRLKNAPFRMSFSGLCDVYFKLVIEGTAYHFSSNQKYGHFSTPNTIYLKEGSAYYTEQWEDEPLDEWLNKPFQNYKAKMRKSWLMTAEKEKEAVDFVNGLCDAIELRLAQKERW